MTGTPRALRHLGAAAALLTSLLVAGCSVLSSGTSPSGGVATNPAATPVTGTLAPGSGSAGASGSAPAQTGGVRTVLTVDGLNMHASPSLSAHVVGTLTWGVTVSVLGYDPTGGPWPSSTSPGAWYHVQGATVSGWIVAEPGYTAQGSLSSISFPDKHIDGALYPSSWTYADDAGELVFEPQEGTDVPTLVVREAASLPALGAAGLPGYTPVSSSSEVVVCGYTGTEVRYQAPSGATPQVVTDAGGAKVTRLSGFVQFRATLSPTVAIDIEMNYATSSDLSVYQNFLDSVRYPFQNCEASPGPSSTPSPSGG